MRLMYTFVWAPWLGGKYRVEMRQCVGGPMKTNPQELRKMFDLFVDGVTVDLQDPSFVHDKARQDDIFNHYTKSDVCT